MPIAACALVVVAGAFASAPPADAKARAAVHRLEARMKEAIARTQDHTAIFYKQERLDDEWQAAEHIELKWRRSSSTGVPAVYMKWFAGLHKGREVLWRGEKTLAVKEGILTLDLDAGGFIVRSDARHHIKESGVVEIAARIVADLDRAQATRNAGVTYELLDDKNVHGALAHCFVATAPKQTDASYYAARTEICIDARTSLPSLIRAYDLVDGREQIVEDYSFANIRTNVGLTDADFARDTYF